MTVAACVRAELDGPPLLERTYVDEAKGYVGHVVVDSLACGTSVGGIRIAPDVSLDVLRGAARAMTWKNRFVGLPNGGAKAGVAGDETLPREERARRVAWLAEQAAELVDAGRFRLGPDMGTDLELVHRVARGRGLAFDERGLPAGFRGSGFYTAVTTVVAAEAALSLAGRTLAGARVAVEGFGAVGSNAARLAAARGATVVAASTSRGGVLCEQGLDLAARDPLARGAAVDAEEVLTAPVDVLFVCGPGLTIDGEVAERIEAAVVSAAANRAFDLDAAEVLHRRARIAVPCFVAGCGGVASGVLAGGGLSPRAIEAVLERLLGRRVRLLLGRADREGRAPLELALATLPPLPGAGSRGGLLGTARRLARSRRVPRPPAAVPTAAYFSWRLGRCAS